MCMPLPAMPRMGLGMKVAYRPCCWARVFSTMRKVTMLSAVFRAWSNRKSISCWPGAISWCMASASMPKAVRVSVICRHRLVATMWVGWSK